MNDAAGNDELMNLVAMYALGVLPAAEQHAVAALILRDPAARAEYEALRPTADLIGMAADEPVDSARSARMKQRLMATVNPQTAPASLDARRAGASGNRQSSWFVGAGLAAAAAVVFALVSTIQNMTLRSDLANADSRTAALQAQIAQNERVQSRDRAMVADLIAADAQRFAVPQGVVVKHGPHIYLTLHALPPLPHGKVYQAWTLAKGAKTVAPSTTFTPSAGGDAVVALPENGDETAAVAVSVEPEGGSKAPTSKPTFFRPLS
jgi:anti-sigma-K factor RskA